MGTTAQLDALAFGSRNRAKRVSELTLLSRSPWESWRTKSAMARALRFMQTYVVVPQGHGVGRPMKVHGFQRDLLEQVLANEATVVSLPRGNGKSGLAVGLALWGLYDGGESAQVPVVATTVQQAIRTMFSRCQRIVQLVPELEERTLVYTAVGATRLVVPQTNSVLMPLPADPAGLQGLDPTLAVIDEVGFVEQALWDAIVLASGKRSSSHVVGIGTPNVERAGAMWELRQRVRSGAVMPGFSYVEVAADEGCNVDDLAQWRRANPAIGAGLLRLDALRTARATVPEPAFRCFRLGQWVKGYTAWLPPDAWVQARDPWVIPDGADVWVGVDVGLHRDCSAVVVCAVRPDGRLHVQAQVWQPQQGYSVDLADVVQALRDLDARFTLQAVRYDPRFMEYQGPALADEGLPMVQFPQSLERMTPVCGLAYELIAQGRVSHDGGHVLNDHVGAAVRRPNEHGFTLSKSRAREPADAAIAMVMALHAAAAPHRGAPAIY